jgi:hypothetical protein
MHRSLKSISISCKKNVSFDFPYTQPKVPPLQRADGISTSRRYRRYNEQMEQMGLDPVFDYGPLGFDVPPKEAGGERILV